MLNKISTHLLSELCEIRGGFTARSGIELDDRNGTRAVQLKDLRGNECSLLNAPKLRLEGKLKRYEVRPGDVLFRSRGENNTACHVTQGANELVIALQPVIILRVTADALSPEYLTWVINQPSSMLHFDRGARGTGLRMIPKDCLESLRINLPELNTQSAIVEVSKLAEKEHGLLMALANNRMSLINSILNDQVQNTQPHANEAGKNHRPSTFQADGQIETDIIKG